MIDGIKHTGNGGHFPVNPASSTDEHARRKMSAFACWLVVPPQLGGLMASAPFHVCQHSGFSPDRADYLSRQAKPNFTSVERHHKASLSGSPPLTSQQAPPPRKQRASLTDICPSRAAVIQTAEILKGGHARQNPTLQISTFVKTKAQQRPLCASIISIQISRRARTPLARISVHGHQPPQP